jgi:predicted PP-loop superfamily ATPase
MITDKNEAIINKILEIIDSTKLKNSSKEDLIKHLKKRVSISNLEKEKIDESLRIIQNLKD